MKEWLPYIAAFITLLAFAAWASSYSYWDCLKVGHENLYCILSLFQ